MDRLLLLVAGLVSVVTGCFAYRNQRKIKIKPAVARLFSRVWQARLPRLIPWIYIGSGALFLLIAAYLQGLL